MAAGLAAYIKPHWITAVLVCARCSHRIGRGFGRGGRHRLAPALRRHLGIGRFRRASIGVVEVGCLGVCPRGAITLANARDPARRAVAPRACDLSALLAQLGIPDQSA